MNLCKRLDCYVAARIKDLVQRRRSTRVIPFIEANISLIAVLGIVSRADLIDTNPVFLMWYVLSITVLLCWKRQLAEFLYSKMRSLGSSNYKNVYSYYLFMMTVMVLSFILMSLSIYFKGPEKEGVAVVSDNDVWAKLGQFGDFFGGFIGTIVAIIALIVVYRSWVTTRKNEILSSSTSVISEMLATHEAILGSITINEKKGRDGFGELLSQFYVIYGIVKSNSAVEKFGISKVLDVSFVYLYYGTHESTVKILIDSGLQKDVALQLNNSISTHKSFLNKKLGGHQNELSHYFRNIYFAFRYIDEAGLDRSNKDHLAKVYRSKLSNYEQAILALNILSSLGHNWVKRGLSDRYAPIKNIPRYFFEFDDKFELKEHFRNIRFEWEDS